MKRRGFIATILGGLLTSSARSDNGQKIHQTLRPTPSNPSDTAELVSEKLMYRSAEGDNAIQRPVAARLRESFVLPGDFFAPEGGDADASEHLARAASAAAAFRRPLLVNGTYRLDAPLPLESGLKMMGAGHLRANHGGSMLVRNSAVPTLERVDIDGLTFEASTQVSKAINGERWQYCNFRNLRFLTAGGIFEDIFFLSNVSYWNSCINIEIEAGLNCFNLWDANNLILDNINWCRFSDIGMKSFMKFHGECSMIHGRNLSAEGVFLDTTLIELSDSIYGIDLEFIRIEGRLGSRNNSFMDFNGSVGNILKLPAATYGIYNGALKNEDGNFIIYSDSKGNGLFRMGTGRAIAPVSQHDPDIDGSFNYQTSLRRLRAFLQGARSFFFSPAIDDLDMNGRQISRVQSLHFMNGVPVPAHNSGMVTIFVDKTSGDLKVRLGNGIIKKITLEP